MSAFDPTHPLAKFIREDGRYQFDAYVFVFESLSYAQKYLNKGGGPPVENVVEDAAEDDVEDDNEPGEDDDELSGDIDPDDPPERHVTGQELCESIRLYALDQFGYMAKCVLNSWGVRSTSDFGTIVFNMIEIGQMRKTENDRREDFDDVFDFDEGLVEQFKITMPEQG